MLLGDKTPWWWSGTEMLSYSVRCYKDSRDIIMNNPIRWLLSCNMGTQMMCNWEFYIKGTFLIPEWFSRWGVNVKQPQWCHRPTCKPLEQDPGNAGNDVTVL